MEYNAIIDSTNQSSFFTSVSSTLSSWSSSLQKETEQSFPGTMKRFGDLTQLVQQKAREFPSNIANLPSALEAEHQQFVKGNLVSKNGRSELVAPWQGYGAYEKRIKQRVLALSKDERNLTIPPPEDTSFQFDIKAYSQSAAAALKYDPELAKLRFRLVPQHVTEPTFWRNYFYRVTLEKQAALSSTDIDPNDTSEEPQDVLFDYAASDDEEDNTEQEKKSQPKPAIQKDQPSEEKKDENKNTASLDTKPDDRNTSSEPKTTATTTTESKDYDGMEEWERELRKAAGEF
ncbi:hypothetical protein O0I10_012736 [Lichtheimia ornata]|uniref:BSD domain-containing protein n=1 Tax=Lichtheimia ornata TaxID=688661 RepID=A0AAD7URA0_9FUNG|nr:uncharacterized protein O0I10_012736 [Lichtheimia ornata]KAJ8651703.1 hypothetical protein O0I10_012736 [Lichtheimia ornata]